MKAKTNTTPKFTLVITSDNKKHKINYYHRLYRLRYALLSRCYNSNSYDTEWYKGKGIRVCNKWKNDPSSFYKWCLENGWKTGLVLTRTNLKGNYTPSNCTFMTKIENVKKMHRQNKKYTFKYSQIKKDKCANNVSAKI